MTFLLENQLIILIGLAVIVFISLLTGTSKSKKEETNRLKQIKHLDALLNAKYKELAELSNQIQNHQMDNSVSLTKLEVKVLDTYEQSGIRISSDIIEDLSAMRLNSESDILTFIENQRVFWKLENTKKPFQRSEAK